MSEYPRDWTRTEREEAARRRGRLSTPSDDGWPRVSREVNESMCAASYWRDADGARFACPLHAAYSLGDLRYCPEHFPPAEAGVRAMVHEAADQGLGHWIYRTLVLSHRSEYDEAVKTRLREVEDYRLSRVEAAKQAAPWGTGNYVYFVRMVTGEGPIKIGTSRDVEKRLAAISWGSPYPIELLAVTPGSHVLEHAYHDRFAAHRMSGEWFKPVAEILGEVAELRVLAEHRSPWKLVDTLF